MEHTIVGDGKGPVGLDNDGVLKLVWKPGTVLVADDVHSAMSKVNEVAGGSEYPMLVDITHTQAATRAAKALFSMKCAASRIALLGSNPVNRVIANFAMARRTLPVPTRFFATVDEAMTWLLDPTTGRK